MVSKRELFESLDASEDIAFLIRLKSNITIADKDECWPWNGVINTQNMPYISRVVDGKQRQFQVRRLMCEIYNPIPGADISLISHITTSCSNNLCVNPFHAEMGSRKTCSGRKSDPKYVNSRKISEDDVSDIISRIHQGQPQKAIALYYKVSPSVISNIKHDSRRPVISSSASS